MHVRSQDLLYLTYMLHTNCIIAMEADSTDISILVIEYKVLCLL